MGTKARLGLIGLVILTLMIAASISDATTYEEDFGSIGDLSRWIAGPSHIDSYGIYEGELFIDGKGSPSSSGGWGVLQYDANLGDTFVASWQTRITYHEYANFVLFAGPPWYFNVTTGYAKNGYVFWLDINDPTYPKLDIMKMKSGTGGDLPGATRNVSLAEDIDLNQWFDWRLEKAPAYIRVFINGTQVIDTYDAEFAHSDFKLGLSFGEDSRGYIDNLRITTPVPAALWLFGSGLLGLVLLRRKPAH
ncbi:MAG: hypothetical protein JW950_05340 [Deltaproteobacteria bacterium]|nr:hypothetical protein [Deltaproteobacteria bacterium]